MKKNKADLSKKVPQYFKPKDRGNGEATAENKYTEKVT